MPTTPNMGLSLPTPSATLGPEWANLLNEAVTLIDEHNHSPEHGVRIPSAGIGIDADLSFGGFNAMLLRSVRFANNTATLSLANDANAIYVSNGDLWYNTGAGLQVQITSGSSLSGGSSGGGIGGTAGTTASASYSPATKTFIFQQATGVPALLDAGPLTIHEPLGTTFGITLQSPAALAAGYSLTLPTALPGATNILTVSSTGQIAAGGPLNANTQTITNVGAPSAATDAATRGYVDTSTAFYWMQFSNNISMPLSSDVLLYPFFVPLGTPAGSTSVAPLDQVNGQATSVVLIPQAGRLRSLFVRTPSAWTANASLIKVWLNGAALATTASFAAGANTASVDLNTAVNAGDRVAVTFTNNSGGNASPLNLIATIKYVLV